MPDGFVQLRQGEVRPVVATISAADGTVQVLGTPAPTCTLYDISGAPVAGMSGLAVSGFDASAAESARVWLTLETAGLTPGFYSLTFTLSALGSDGIVRVMEPNAGIQILRSWE